jgi:hypothetical protein
MLTTLSPDKLSLSQCPVQTESIFPAASWRPVVGVNIVEDIRYIRYTLTEVFIGE